MGRMKGIVAQPGRIYDLPMYPYLLHIVAIAPSDPLVDGDIVILFQGIDTAAPHDRGRMPAPTRALA